MLDRTFPCISRLFIPTGRCGMCPGLQQQRCSGHGKSRAGRGFGLSIPATCATARGEVRFVPGAEICSLYGIGSMCLKTQLENPGSAPVVRPSYLESGLSHFSPQGTRKKVHSRSLRTRSQGAWRLFLPSPHSVPAVPAYRDAGLNPQIRSRRLRLGRR